MHAFFKIISDLNFVIAICGDITKKFKNYTFADNNRDDQIQMFLKDQGLKRFGHIFNSTTSHSSIKKPVNK